MRKLMLFLMSGAAALGFAFEPQAAAPSLAPESRADNSYTIQFCGDLRGWEGFEEECDVVQYIYVTPERATELAGNKITAIGYAPCLQGYSTDAKVKGTVFVSEDVDGDPVHSMNITILNSYHKPSGSYFQEGAFSRSKQYEIKAGQGFYFGFTMPSIPGDYPVALDKAAGGEFSGVVDTYKDGVRTGRYPVGETWGGNLLMYARTTGPASMGDAFVVGDLLFGYMTLPVFDNADPMTPYIYIENRGTTVLNTCDYSYSFDDGQAVSASVPLGIQPGDKGLYPVKIDAYPTGRHTLSVAVDKINNTSASGAASSTGFFNVGDQGYGRKFVMEEGTGLWCQYCPLGIVSMERMEQACPDDFVGIAVHSGDAFQVPAYAPLIEKFFIGFPQAVINRDPAYVISPYYVTVEDVYKEFKLTKAPAAIELGVSVDNTWINIDAATTFCVDDPGKTYKLVFVIREDGLVGTQKNGFSGQYNDEMDYAGWEDRGQQVKWEFLHTARGVDDCWGSASSAIESPAAGQTYNASSKISVRCVSETAGARNLDKAYAIALLIDDESGIVANAAQVNIQQALGIESVGADAEAGPAEYYNMQGQKLANPRAGQPCIRVQGGKAEKVIF